MYTAAKAGMIKVATPLTEHGLAALAPPSVEVGKLPGDCVPGALDGSIVLVKFPAKSETSGIRTPSWGN